jgi:integrase
VQLGPGRYKVFFQLPSDKYGRRSRTSRTISDSDDATARDLAERELRKHLVATDEGHAPASRGRTVGDALDEWLRDIATIRVQATTLERYEGLIDLHIRSELGRTQLMNLRPADIQRLVALMARKGLSHSTVRQTVVVLRQALQNEVRNDRLSANPATPDRVDMPTNRKPRKLHRPLTPAEARKLIDAAVGLPLELPVLLGLCTGLRRGEIVCLRWRDVDLEDGRLTVREAAQRVKGEDGRRTITTT